MGICSNKTVRIISHRRSGTHFLWETLKLNFDVEADKSVEGQMGGFKYHRTINFCNPVNILKNRNCICLLRDGRDTIVANWYYWKSGGEPKFKIRELLEDFSFSDFLRGELPKKRIELTAAIPIIRDHLQDPINHWLAYTDWKKLVFTIKFEDLKNNPEETILRIGNEFGWSVKSEKVEIIDHLVGNFKRKGIIGDWKNNFVGDDLEFFWKKAGDRMEELGYSK
ncbi:sulfotransferase domain-containing protein [candidate division WOR-3 bacterium]|nr:sulfotransferase domain-containing protein [Candidatus Parcubacteria bacterium]MCK4528474.1 sulfotransferase domain-containing protein [candidate division WOR-3 bacterium]